MGSGPRSVPANPEFESHFFSCDERIVHFGSGSDEDGCHTSFLQKSRCGDPARPQDVEILGSNSGFSKIFPAPSSFTGCQLGFDRVGDPTHAVFAIEEAQTRWRLTYLAIAVLLMLLDTLLTLYYGTAVWAVWSGDILAHGLLLHLAALGATSLANVWVRPVRACASELRIPCRSQRR